MALPEMSGKVAGGFGRVSIRMRRDFVMILLVGIRRGPVLRPARLEILILSMDFRGLGIGNIEFQRSRDQKY